MEYALALCFELAAGDKLPEQLLLIPAGKLKGIDGRAWLNNEPAKVIEKVQARGLDSPVDIEHATQMKGPLGEPAPAQGWIKVDTHTIEDGAIWSDVDWNQGDSDLVTNREYLLYSPVFYHGKSGLITDTHSVGLTNIPNLSNLPVLNRATTAETKLAEQSKSKLESKAARIADNLTLLLNFKTRHKNQKNSRATSTQLTNGAYSV